MKNKEKTIEINSIIKEQTKSLDLSSEDLFLMGKLVDSYFRKRISISNSAKNSMAAAFLLVYSKSNFLWEDKRWMRQNLAILLGAKSSTIGQIAAKIIKTLKIEPWDERFCKQSVMKNNPYDKYILTSSGMIVPKDMTKLFESFAKRKVGPKEDYFDKAMDFLEQDEEEKAIEYLNKALTLNENYIEAISKLGLIYFDKDIEKSKEYYQKAVELSKKELGGYWPKKLEWGIWENRSYLRAIQGLALIFWKENEIEEAKKLFALLLSLNPHDNQGVRYCLAAVYKGLTWDNFGKIEDKCTEMRDYEKLDELLKKQNNFYKFWKNPEENEQ